MDDLDSANFDTDTKGFSLIDVSVSDDDFLFASSSSDANAVDIQGVSEEAHMDKPSDLLAVQRPRKPGKYNLRKSLAWDSAFFTSAGVLDAEELSSIMEGAETCLNQNHKLSGIQEELSKSTDSITTLESDNLTLESIEADLFSDIRASIQRSSMVSDSGNKNGEAESGNGCSRKIGQPSSGNMVKPKLASRKLIPAVQGPARVLKPPSIGRQVTKPIVRGRELSSKLLRSPVPTGKASLEGATASKRASVGASHSKAEINHAGNVKVAAGKEALILKGPHQVDSRNTLQKSLASSKLPSVSSVSNKIMVRRSQSSYDSSNSSSTTTKYYSQKESGSASSISSSENIRKSQSGVVRRKIDNNANLPPVSKIRIPSRLPVKSKSRPGESQLSAYVKSNLEPSPSISPASSISEWSVESSSSTATVNRKHGGLKNGVASEDVIVDSNVSGNMQKQSNDKSLDRRDHQVASTMGQSAKQPSRGAVMSLARPGSAKPSGLRLPSPNIGYFDGAKTGTKTPSGGSRTRSAIPSNLSRSAASPTGSSNKAMSVSVAVKVSTSLAKTSKVGSHKSQASPKLTKQLQYHLIDSPSGYASGTSCEVSMTTLANSAIDSNSITANAVDVGIHVDSTSEAKNQSTGLQKDSVSMIVNHGSDASIDLPKCNSTKFSLEQYSEVSREADGEKHLPEISPIAKDHSEVVLQTANVLNIDDETETNSELFISSSPGVGRNNKVAKVEGREYHPDDCSPVFNENLFVSKKEAIKEAVDKAADGGTDVDSGLDAKNQPTGLQKDLVSMIVNDGSVSSIELPKCSSTKFSLEQNSEVLKEADGEKHLPEISPIAKDHSDIVLQTANGPNIDNETEPNSELFVSSSPGIGRNIEVAKVEDREDHPDDCGSVFNENFIVSEKEATEETIVKAADGGTDVTDSGLDGKNHSNGLQKDPVSMIVNDGSHTFMKLPKSLSTISALERNTAVLQDGGEKHIASVSLIAKDQSEIVLKTTVPKLDDKPETCSEPFMYSSHGTGRDDEVAEVEDGREYLDDCGPAFNDDLIVSKKEAIEETIVKAADGGTDVADYGLDAENHSSGLRKDQVSMIVNDGSHTFVELPKSTSTISALESNAAVLEEDDGGKHFAEASFIVEDLTAVVRTSSVLKVDDEPETNSTLLRCSSPEIGRDNKVTDVKGKGELSDDYGSAFNDDFAVSGKIRRERNITVPGSADEGRHAVDSCSEVENHSTDLRKDSISMIVNTSMELPKSTSTNPALVRHSEVSEDVGKHFLEASVLAEDLSEVVLRTSSVPIPDDEREITSEPLKYSSPVIGRESEAAEVMNRGEHRDDCSSFLMVDFVALKNEEIRERELYD